ncbi:unnamed protein product, partial [Allacma fusca]
SLHEKSRESRGKLDPSRNNQDRSDGFRAERHEEQVN